MVIVCVVVLCVVCRGGVGVRNPFQKSAPSSNLRFNLRISDILVEISVANPKRAGKHRRLSALLGFRG